MKNTIMLKVKGLDIRFAQKADVPHILEFIKELAAYERLSHEVVADEETLEKSLFSNRRVAEVLITEFEREPVGFALFFHNFSTFLGKPGIYLEDFYVQPDVRGKGIGEAVLAFLARLAEDRGCGRLEWSVLDWNEPAIRFYKNLGAQPLADWTTYRITGMALKSLAKRV